jgi:pyruvate-formate lyase
MSFLLKASAVSLKKPKKKIAAIAGVTAEEMDTIDFYRSVIIASQGIITLANRYATKAREMAAAKQDKVRRSELLKIAEICSYVPENPPRTFHEALQFVWFTQLGGILSENPLALNPGRFDQYMYPYYKADVDSGRLTRAQALELIECLWLKFSEWVWTISANTAEFFAGYNQFQNLTIGGRTRDGADAINEVSYLCLEATEEVKTHQPGLSVKIHPDSPEEFMAAVTHLVSKGTGFPAIHNDIPGRLPPSL